MKILLINQAFWPDVAATAQHLTDFAVALAREGHEVRVLTARRSYTEPHPVLPPRENYQGVQIVRLWPWTFGRRSRIARILDALFLNMAFALMLFWLPRHDRIVSLTSPPLVAWFASWYARLRGIPFIYWMMDINPDEAVAAGWLSKDSVQARVLEKALQATLQRSWRVIVLDRFMKERIVGKGTDPSKVVVLPPWPHEEELESIPHKENPFRHKFGLDRKFVVMYSGNHSICHSLDTLLEAALCLRDDPAIRFLFIGGGERVRDVREFKERHALENIIQLPYQERRQMKYSLSSADLHIVVLGDPFLGIVHPSKIYGILKVGRPFVYIGPRESHISDLIAEGADGIRIGHGEVERLVEVIRQRKQDAARQGSDSAQPHHSQILERYGQKILIDKLKRIVTRDAR